MAELKFQAGDRELHLTAVTDIHDDSKLVVGFMGDDMFPQSLSKPIDEIIGDWKKSSFPVAKGNQGEGALRLLLKRIGGFLKEEVEKGRLFWSGNKWTWKGDSLSTIEITSELQGDKMDMEPGMYQTRLLGSALYTDNKELADFLNKDAEKEKGPQAKSLDKRFPGLLDAVIAARRELESERFAVDSMLHRRGRVQASAGPSYMCIASNWHSIG